MASKYDRFGHILNKEIERRFRHKERAKNLTWTLKISVFSLTGIATIALGLDLSELTEQAISKSFFTNLALICTTLATVLTSVLGLWKVDEYWIKQRAALEALHGIRRRFQYLENANEEVSGELVDVLFEEFESVLKTYAEYWETVSEKRAE